jgi:Pyruvate/2-oxoacid:ferredoxin oxidoreductase delta subunit
VNKDDRAYVQLQRHLDSQPVGFPATRSKAEIRVLKHIFTPQQAEIAAHLSYKPEPLEVIFPRVKHLVKSPEELSDMLDAIQKKGGIESSAKHGKRQYCNPPFVVGMLEMQGERLTPDFVKDVNEYGMGREFRVAFLSATPPQMRTIPVAESIRPQSKVSTFDEVAALVRLADAPHIVFECGCRKWKSLQRQPCKVTDRKETCFAFGSMAQSFALCGMGREVTRDETMSILKENQKQGLVLQPSNTEKAEFICSCCGCCCIMLGMHQQLPKPLDYWVSNFHSAVNVSVCDGCGACQKRCQIGAITISAKGQPAVVNLDRCVGCGVCVSTCSKKAMFLVKRPRETAPPKTREELFDIIMANKKNMLGRWGVVGKLLFDAVITGQAHLLKPQKPARG